MESPRKVFGEVELRVLDCEGNILRSIHDHNSETLWAQLVNTPSIYLDFVVSDWKSLFGIDLIKLNKTGYSTTQTNKMRANLLTSAFTRTGTTYTCKFNWTNTTQSNVTIYALISFDGSRNLYTVFDLESNPIVVAPQNVVIGQYNITYTGSVPSFPTSTNTATTVQDTNTRLTQLRDALSPDVRKYKYQRIFVKTSDYLGCDLLDTGVQSSTALEVTSSRADARGISIACTTELTYKIVLGGQLGGAKAVRYFHYYPSLIASGTLNGIFSSDAGYLFYPALDSTSYGDGISYPEAYATIRSYETTRTIKPFKIKFPDTSTLFGNTTKWTNIPMGGLDRYTHLWYGPFGANDRQGGMIMYLYWPAAPLFSVYTSNAFFDPVNAMTMTSQMPTVKLYINGAEYTATNTLISRYSPTFYNIARPGNVVLTKHTFNLSSLTAGSGIVAIAVQAATYSGGSAGRYDYVLSGAINRGFKLVITGDMYGYAVPYAGMLTPDSGTITENWISSSFANVANVDQVASSYLPGFDQYAALNLVQNTNLANLAQYTDGQTWVWVTQDQANNVAGIIEPGNEGKVPFSKTINTNDGTYVDYNYYCPIFEGPFTFFTVTKRSYDGGTWGRGASFYVMWSDFSYYEHLTTAPVNPSLDVDVVNRELIYKDDKSFEIPYGVSDKGYLTRQQGSSTYDVVPYTATSYTEGVPTVTVDMVVWEYETLIESTEYVKYLTIEFDAGSLLVTNEYITIPISDNEHQICVDSLEKWYITTSVSPATTADPIKDSFSVGVDELITNDKDIAIRTHQPIGDLEEISIFTPSTSMNLSDGRFTHYLTYVIGYDSASSVIPHIAIPKYIDDGGTKRFVDVTDIYLTDGLHVIPWSLDAFGHDISDDLGIEERFDFWIIVPNVTTLDQLYPRPKELSIAVYAYVVAKSKADWLPLTFDIDYTDITGNLSTGYMTKVTLPFCVDRYIKVTDSEDNPLNFTVLRDFNFPIETDADVGNVLYLELPTMAKAQELKQSFMKFSVKTSPTSRTTTTATSVANLISEMTPFAPNMHASTLSYDTYSSLALNTSQAGLYHGGTYLSANDMRYFEEFNFSLSPDWIAHPTKLKITIATDSVNNLQVPGSFFRLYATPDTILTKAAQTYNLNQADYQKTKRFFNYTKSNAGLAFNVATVNTEPLELECFTGTGITKIKNFSVVNATTLSSSTGNEVGITSSHNNCMYLVRNYSETYTIGLSHQNTYTDSSLYQVVAPYDTQPGTQLLVYDAASISTLLVYKKSAFVRHSYQYLNIEAHRPSRIYGTEVMDFYMCKPNEINPIKTIEPLTPTMRMLTTNKSLNHTFGPSVYNVPSAGIPDTFSLYTYTMQNVAGQFAHYSNRTGSFILVDPNLTTNYDVLVSNRLRGAAEVAKPQYMFTVNSDLSNLLTSGYAFNVPLGFMSVTTEQTVAKGTACTATPSSTILLMDKVAPISSYSYPYNMQLFGVTERGKTVAQLITPKKEDYFKSVKEVSVVTDASLLRYIDRSVSTTNGGQCMLGLKQPIFDHQHIHQLYLTKTVPDFQALNGCKIYPLSKVLQTYTSRTSLDEDAVFVDTQIVARSNKRFNVLFDEPEIPIQSIQRFGHFSPHLYTDEHGIANISIVPIVKLLDTVLSEEAIFAIDNQYYVPVDITLDVPQITVDNIQTRIFDHYLANCYTYDHFNRLLVTYDDPRYNVQLGFIIYSANDDRLVVFNGLSVQIILTDKSDYVPVKWCYANHKAGVLSDDKSTLAPSSSIKIKLYNPNDTGLVNTPTKIDISTFSPSSYDLGLVFSVEGIPIPTAYETDTIGHVSTEYVQANNQNAWVRIPTIDAKSFIEITAVNMINSYTVDDVFDFYEGFIGTEIDPTKWTLSLSGNTAVSDGVFSIHGNSSVVNGIATVQSLSPSLRYEICYQTESPNRPSIWELEMGYGDVVATSMPSLQNDTVIQRLSRDEQHLLSNQPADSLVPYWNDRSAEETWLRAPLKTGDNTFYVYYNGTNATDVSNGSAVFLLFEDHSQLEYDPNKWHILDNAMYSESQWTNRYLTPSDCRAKTFATTTPITDQTTALSFNGSTEGISYIKNMTDCALGNGNFTVDMWVYSKDAGTPSATRTLFTKSGGRPYWDATNAGIAYYMFHSTDNKLYFRWSTGAATYGTLASTNTVSIGNGWHHIAVVQDNTNIIMYLDGASIGQVAKASVTDVTTGLPQFSIGCHGLDVYAYSWYGYITNFRLSVGTARWTGGFTPPTTKHTSDSYTRILVYGDEAEGSSSILDYSGTGKQQFMHSIIVNINTANANHLYTSRRFFDRDKYAIDFTCSASSGYRDFILGWSNLFFVFHDRTASIQGLFKATRDRTTGVMPQTTHGQATRIDTWYPGNQTATTIPGRFSLMVNSETRVRDKVNNHTYAAGLYNRELGRVYTGGTHGWTNSGEWYPVSAKELRVRHWKNNSNLSYTYGSVEQSTWVVDGVTFTRRIPVTVNSAVDLESYQFVFDAKMWGSDFNIRVKGSGGSSQIRPYVEYETTCSAVVSSLRPYNGAVSFSHQPIEENVWWVEKIKKNDVSCYAPSSGKLNVAARPAQDSDVVKIYWVRARTYSKLDLVQIEEADLSIMVEKKSTDWYLFDGTGSNASDKTYIQNCLDSAASTMMCGRYNKEMWMDFPDQTRYNSGIPGSYGRYLEYRK
jgi:hypothetical protein